MAVIFARQNKTCGKLVVFKFRIYYIFGCHMELYQFWAENYKKKI